MTVPPRPPGEWKVCKECGRVLDYYDGPSFAHGIWLHTAQDAKGADHRPVPIDMSQTTPNYRCDFCNADRPTWDIPSKDFWTPLGTIDRGGWGACDTCAELVRTDQWSALKRRVILCGIQRGHDPDIMAVAIGPLYRLLRENITGPPQRIDPE